MSYFDARFIAPVTAPSDIPSLLSSWGVTWYGGFRRGLNQFSVSTDQLTPATTLGASVGQWAANWSAGGFSAKWIQSTNSKRPSYMSALGTTGIQGDATTTWMQLDSTTDLNRDHTVLIATAMPVLSGARAYSHNSNRMGLYSASAITNLPNIYANNSLGSQVAAVVEATPYDASSAWYRVGWRSVGNLFYGNAPNLFRLSSGSSYSEAVLIELWLIGAHLTNAQIATCLPFMVF